MNSCIFVNKTDVMRPQDIVILLKILCYGHAKWYSKDLAKDLFLSPAEISYSLERSIFSGLIDSEKNKVRVQALMEFLIYGMPYIFPQRPASITRGMPTAHSHPFMRDQFISDQQYVWPDAAADEKGFSVQPLYPGATEAAKKDEKLYLMLALIDVLRMGRPREKKVAIAELKKLMEL
jgi:hypothetical protein